MQAATQKKDALTDSGRRVLRAVRACMLLSTAILAASGIWYIAITGLVGRKKWDFGVHGIPPLVLAVCGAVLLAASIVCYFTLPALKGRSHRTAVGLWKDRYRYSLILPGLIVVFVFSYMPMYGLIMAENFIAYRRFFGSGFYMDVN